MQVQELISELNEILAHDIVDEAGVWKKKLTPQSLELFDFLPPAIQEQLMLERDPHGNVQVYTLLHVTLSKVPYFGIIWEFMLSFLLFPGCQN